MTSSRQEYVVAFWDKKCSPAPTTALRSAIAGGLLSCLAFDEILELLLPDSALDDRLHQKALGRLIEASEELPTESRSRAARRLLKLATVTPYPHRLRVESLLEQLYSRVAAPTRRSTLRTFLESRTRNQRRRAYTLIREDRRGRWQPMLAEAWRTWRDREAALLIVDQFDTAFLVQHLKELASDLDGTAGMPRLFMRAAGQQPRLLAQLRMRDGITYAYVCARLSKSVSARAATKLIEEHKNDERLRILAWSLGKLGHWRLLVDLSEEVEEIENRQRQKQYERMGLSPETLRPLTEEDRDGA